MFDSFSGHKNGQAVDFDEVTHIFEGLKSLAAVKQTPEEFSKLLQEKATGPIFDKYFDQAVRDRYDQTDLKRLVEHVMDCINSIMPDSLPYMAIQTDDGYWIMVSREDNDFIKKSRVN